ncbi:MAG: ABC transporter permease [Acetobacter sp.]|nr:ABC transporter permease [Acetobacter sp.]
MAVTLKENNGDFVLLLYGEPDSGSSEKLKNNTASGLDSTRLQQLKERGQTKIFAETPEGQPYASLPTAELFGLAKQIQAAGLTLDLSRLPKNIRDMLTLALKVENRPPKDAVSQSGLLERIGKKSFIIYEQVKSALRFMHETNLSLLRFFSGRAIWRRKDFWFIFGDCSYKAVGIIALVSFLVGLILAFVGALQLRTFGAGIYVASMVALGMTRIMAAIMVGIIMAGRTGSSYAATLGTMQVNEEIDALKTLGIKISDYLVTPRLMSLVVTIPFLTLLADALGILGGAVVGVSFLDLSSSSYFDYSIKALSLKNILVGLMHSVVYGIIISLCGCYEGLNAGRDADSVGKATTGAVVTALVWMIVATGVLTVILEEMGI